MMTYMFAGNLTRDAELKRFDKMDAISFSLAINRTTRNGEQQATFVNCSYRVKDGTKLLPYLTKGNQLIVKGSWYENRQSKNGNYYQTFYIDQLTFGRKVDNGNSWQKSFSPADNKPDAVTPDLEEDDDLPF